MASRLLPRGFGQARIGLQPHVSSDRRGGDPIQGERGRQGLLGPPDDLDVDERTRHTVHHPGHGQLHRDQAGMAASGSRLRLGRTRGSGSSPKGPPPGVVLGGFSPTFLLPPFHRTPPVACSSLPSFPFALFLLLPLISFGSILPSRAALAFPGNECRFSKTIPVPSPLGWEGLCLFWDAARQSLVRQGSRVRVARGGRKVRLVEAVR